MTRARWTAAALILLLLAAGALAALLAARAQSARDPFVESEPPPGLAERFYPPQGWAWGVVGAPGGPLQRYGVAAPATVARVQVLILPDYGESAETWFETARDLTGAGFTVWVLDGVGQGGSARLSGRRDLGEVASFDDDVSAVRDFSDDVIRPGPGRPLVVLGEGVGALVAARAVETGLRPAGVILSAPDCATPPSYDALRFAGLGSLRAGSGEPWSRDGPDDQTSGRTHDRWRGAVTHLWQLGNPDLRMGGPSVDWDAAFARLQAQTIGHTTLPAPSLSIDGACLDPAASAHLAIAGADPALELEDDAHRGPWLAAVVDFIRRAAPSQQSTPAHAP